MSASTVRFLCIALLLAFLASVPVAAFDCSPIGAIASATGITPSSILGNVRGDLEGAFQGVATSTVPNPDGTISQSGKGSFVAVNPEDTLKVRFETLIVPVSATEAYVTSTFTLGGGTGDLSGASGELVVTGEADLTTSRQTLRLRGELCLPN